LHIGREGVDAAGLATTIFGEGRWPVGIDSFPWRRFGLDFTRRGRGWRRSRVSCPSSFGWPFIVVVVMAGVAICVAFRHDGWPVFDRRRSLDVTVRARTVRSRRGGNHVGKGLRRFLGSFSIASERVRVILVELRGDWLRDNVWRRGLGHSRYWE
jgi:hypothetical protein